MLFRKKAEVLIFDTFEYNGYALSINAKKTTILYACKHNSKSFKMNKHLWGVKLNSIEEKMFLDIIRKYITC